MLGDVETHDQGEKKRKEKQTLGKEKRKRTKGSGRENKIDVANASASRPTIPLLLDL